MDMVPEIRSERQNLCYFCPFNPNNLENQNFEKMKQVCGDVIIYTYVPKIMLI